MLPFWRNRLGLLRWFLSALAETAVVIPWMILLYSSETGPEWPDALPGSWLLLLTYLAAALWEAGDRKNDPRRRLYALLAGSAVSYLLAYQALPEPMQTGLLGWNKAVLFLPVGGYLWFQGARSTLQGIEYGQIFSRFGIQFGGQLTGIILLILSGAAGNPRVQLLLYWSVFLLFGAGLTLLLITRGRALQADQAKLGEKGEGSGTTPALTALILGLGGLTMAASYLLSVERLLAALSWVRQLVSPLTDWLWQVASLILIRWLMLLEPLMSLLRRVPRREQQEFKVEEGPEEPSLFELEEMGPGVDLTPYLKAALLIGFFLVLLSWLYRLNRRHHEGADGEEERISLGFWRSLWADLMVLLRQRTRPVISAVTAAVKPDDPRDPRALFRRLQTWGGHHGRPRREAETPSRYREGLAELYPEADRPAEAVTAVYNQARYGRRPPEEEAVDAARAALERLEKRPE